MLQKNVVTADVFEIITKMRPFFIITQQQTTIFCTGEEKKATKQNLNKKRL
jgi:hypothetical protein